MDHIDSMAWHSFSDAQALAWTNNGPTLRNDLPDEHDKEDGPEKTDALRSHLVVIVKCLEEVGRRDCGEAVRPMVKTGV